MGAVGAGYGAMVEAMELVANGRVKAGVSTTIKLEETPQMHALLEQRQIFGRAVIQFR